MLKCYHWTLFSIFLYMYWLEGLLESWLSSPKSYDSLMYFLICWICSYICLIFSIFLSSMTLLRYESIISSSILSNSSWLSYILLVRECGLLYSDFDVVYKRCYDFFIFFPISILCYLRILECSQKIVNMLIFVYKEKSLRDLEFNNLLFGAIRNVWKIFFEYESFFKGPLFVFFIFKEANLHKIMITKNLIGSGGVSLQIYSNPSVIWGITLSIKYCLMGLDFSFRILISFWVNF